MMLPSHPLRNADLLGETEILMCSWAHSVTLKEAFLLWGLDNQRRYVPGAQESWHAQPGHKGSMVMGSRARTWTQSPHFQVVTPWAWVFNFCASASSPAKQEKKQYCLPGTGIINKHPGSLNSAWHKPDTHSLGMSSFYYYYNKVYCCSPLIKTAKLQQRKTVLEALITLAFSGEVTCEPSWYTKSELGSQGVMPCIHSSFSWMLEADSHCPGAPGKWKAQSLIIQIIFQRCM